MRPLLQLACLTLLLGGPARADVWELSDGTRVRGAPIGQAPDRWVVLTVEGERTLPAASVTGHTEEAVEPALARKAARAREAWVEKRGREARAAVRRHARARDTAAREQAAAGLQAFTPAELIGPLEDALEDADAATRALALERLGASPAPEATDALLRAAMTAKKGEVRAGAHRAAAARDGTRTRVVYEEVLASPTRPARRVRALEQLGVMASKDSIPGLILALEKITSEMRATLATAGGLKRVPVDLGSTTAAGTQVPIELPEMQLVEVATSSTVSVLRALHGGTAKLLSSLAGVDRGDDPAAWRRWWDESSRGGAGTGARR